MATDDERIPLATRAAQIVLGLVGLAGAGLHAFPLRLDPAVHENWPLVDAVDIGWLALCVVAVLLPSISEITLGGASLKLREFKKDAAEQTERLREVAEEFANLAQNWSSSATIYIDLLSRAQSDDERATLLRNYLRDRMGEAAGFLSDDEDDEVRIILWLYNPESDRIEFDFTNGTPPTKKSYERGEGLIGQAFLEQRRYNEPDVTRTPGYLKTRQGDPPYNAVLCVPVSIGDQRLGMLTVDKQEAAIFSTAADDVARGLAAQCALAIDQFLRDG